jgi:FMN reductase
MTNVVILSGSPSEHTRLNGIRDHVIEYFKTGGLSTEVINIRELPAEDLIIARFESLEIKSAIKKVELADVVVILTPIYKASYSGILKVFLDLLPQNVLSGKLVLPLAIGGSFGHLLVIDYALKPVLFALGATKIEKGTFILDSHVSKLGDHQYELDVKARNRLDASLTIITPCDYTRESVPN